MRLRKITFEQIGQTLGMTKSAVCKAYYRAFRCWMLSTPCTRAQTIRSFFSAFSALAISAATTFCSSIRIMLDNGERLDWFNSALINRLLAVGSPQ
jgi:hypothetical protein